MIFFIVSYARSPLLWIHREISIFICQAKGNHAYDREKNHYDIILSVLLVSHFLLRKNIILKGGYDRKTHTILEKQEGEIMGKKVFIKWLYIICFMMGISLTCSISTKAAEDGNMQIPEDDKRISNSREAYFKGTDTINDSDTSEDTFLNNRLTDDSLEDVSIEASDKQKGDAINEHLENTKKVMMTSIPRINN